MIYFVYELLISAHGVLKNGPLAAADLFNFEFPVTRVLVLHIRPPCKNHNIVDDIRVGRFDCRGANRRV